jgi:hypothetical protein
LVLGPDDRDQLNGLEWLVQKRRLRALLERLEDDVVRVSQTLQDE